MKRLFLALVVAASAGCNSPAPPPKMNAVTGSVTYDGRPAKGVQVYLVPTSAPMPPEVPRNPYGVTDEAGKFSISTHGGNDGAAEGGYQITLLWPGAEAGNESDVEDRFQTWYDAAHSKLTAQIKPGTNDLPPIAVPVITGPPPKSQGIPGRN